MNPKRILVIAILSLTLLISACSQPAASTPAPVQTTQDSPPPAAEESIVDLVEQKALEFWLTSSSINQLTLSLRNLSTRPLQVNVPIGTFFVNQDPDSQNMVVLHPAGVAVPAERSAQLVLEVACANLHRSEPTRSDKFTLRQYPEPFGLASLVATLDQAVVDYPVAQAAVWILTDNASYDELGLLVKDSRFGLPVIDENAAARALLLMAKNGLKVHEYAIWNDLPDFGPRLSERDVRDWLKTLQPTQEVLQMTQTVIAATLAVESTAAANVEATAIAGAQATQAALDEAEGISQATLSPEQLARSGHSIPTPTGEEIAQWAEKASASSEYSNTRWSARQVRGAPDTPDCGDQITAWASESSSGTDWLLLTYSQAVVPTWIVVFETFNPGAVVQVEVIAEDGAAQVVYQAAAAQVEECPRALVIPVSEVSFPVKQVRLTLEHSAWSEIDAVQLIGLPQY